MKATIEPGIGMQQRGVGRKHQVRAR